MRTKVAEAEVTGSHVTSVTAVQLEGSGQLQFEPAFVLDATELGDMLPLTGTDYIVGAESLAQTGEPHAQPGEPRPDCIQSFTYVARVERRPRGENHTLTRPSQYEHFRTTQPYSLTVDVHGGEVYGEESGRLSFTIFEKMPGAKGGLWDYRRVVDARQFGPGVETDFSILNWPGNDYRAGNIIDASPIEMATMLQSGKRLSLGFLYWLQTKAQASSGRFGAPELRLSPELMGSADGLAKFSYIRESRRIVALSRVVEQDVSLKFQMDLAAQGCADSVGIGWYPIDIHPSGADEVGLSSRTHPFQIPLGALIPVRTRNLLAAAKNIGTTHITNGCFRLHPVEWNIGESAGSLAAFCMQHETVPSAAHTDPQLLSAFQASLMAVGIPLTWPRDLEYACRL